MVLCGIAMILLMAVALRQLGAGPGRTAAALALPALSPALLGPLLLTRFDLLPAALVAGALAAVLTHVTGSGRECSASGSRSSSGPAAAAPASPRWWWRRDGRRAAIACSVCVRRCPSFCCRCAGRARGRRRRASGARARGRLQIESLGAAVLLALHHAAGLPLGWASSHGSQNLTGAVAVVAAAVTGVAQVLVLGWLWVRFARGPADGERLVRYGRGHRRRLRRARQGAVAAVPRSGCCRSCRSSRDAAGSRAACSSPAACLLTRAWFPGDYWGS